MQLTSVTKIVALCLVALLLSSCMALFELIGVLGALSSDTPMPLVRAELGQPEWSGRDHRGFQVDRFQLVQGYSNESGRVPASRGSSALSLAPGTRIKVTVTYDGQHRVKTVKVQDEQGREIPLESLAGISK